ncbi:hypothetical protein LguiB_002856 [Lonicera macranthoides]
MASGTLSADKLREKHRWGDGNKVYRRKFHKKALKNTTTTATDNDNNNKEIAAAATPATNNDNNNNNAAAAVTTTTVTPGSENDNNNNETTTATAMLATDNDNNKDTATAMLATNIDNYNNETTAIAPAINNDDNNKDTTTALKINDDNNNEITTATNNNDNDKEENGNNGNNDLEQSSQTLATEDANLSQQQQQNPSRINVASEDSSTQNCLPEVGVVRGELAIRNGVVKPVVMRVGDRVKIDLGAAKSKNEIRELRRKLMSELDQVRSSLKSLEAKEVQVRHSLKDFEAEDPQLIANDDLVQPTSYYGGGAGGGYDHSLYSASDMIDRRALTRGGAELHSANNVIERRGLMRANSEIGSVPLHNSRPFRQLSVSVMENHNHAVREFMEREKRTPKANTFYQNSEFLLAKDRLPPESNRKPKSNGGRKLGGEMEYGFGIDRYRSQVLKSCSNLLQRLMKHKHGWVFNEPVNAKLLGLHDYHDIIKHPMDLGTVKTRLAQNFYKSPREFAEDVRLTFRNAMTYNPKGQDVHVMAEQLLNVFEERWAVIENEYNVDWRFEMVHDVGLRTPTSRKAPHYPPPYLSAPQMRTFDRSESMTATIDSRLKPSNFPLVSRTPVPKKPKAKDPNKRDMTWEEKQRLSTHLQSLPSEKLDNIVQIIKKRNSALSQHDDEIEVDIDSVDAETLWELDRFVTNYKKSLSKNKRKAELALQRRAEAGQSISAMNAAPTVLEASKERKTDQKNCASSSPGHVEKQRDNVSRSSSSSSSSSDSGSSSSDSDSDSSSADGSDAGHA